MYSGVGRVTGRRATIPRGVLIGTAAVAGLLFMAALVVVLASRPVGLYPADTPEGTFQRYLEAFQMEELETAYGYLSAREQQHVSFERFSRAADDYRRWGPYDERLTLERVDIRGERATVHLVAHYPGGGPFSGGWQEPLSIRLVREPDGWRIDEPLIGTQRWDFYEYDELGP
jgi:hypothetical protein